MQYIIFTRNYLLKALLSFTGTLFENRSIIEQIEKWSEVSTFASASSNNANFCSATWTIRIGPLSSFSFQVENKSSKVKNHWQHEHSVMHITIKIFYKQPKHERNLIEEEQYQIEVNMYTTTIKLYPSRWSRLEVNMYIITNGERSLCHRTIYHRRDKVSSKATSKHFWSIQPCTSQPNIFSCKGIKKIQEKKS